eukprot:9156983-Heterocapsa_arctica.AAC.1
MGPEWQPPPFGADCEFVHGGLRKPEACGSSGADESLTPRRECPKHYAVTPFAQPVPCAAWVRWAACPGSALQPW